MDKNGVISLLGMAGFVVMADNWVVSPILPAIACDLGIDITNAGLLITAYMLLYGLFQLVFGPLADRYGKKQVITFSTMAFTVATGLCALGTGLADLMVYRALTGVFAASVLPISMAMLGDLFPPAQRQGAIGSFMGLAFLGQGVSMAIGGVTVYFLNWRAVFALYSLFAVLPTVALLRAYGSLPSRQNPEARFWTPYRKLLSDGRSLATYVVVLLESVFIVGAFSYLGAYISATHHYNYLHIGLIMSAFGVATVIGGRLSGWLARVVGPRKVLTLGLLSAMGAELLLALWGQWLGPLVAAVALLGFGFIFTHSTLLTRATEFANRARGSAMSLVAFCFMGGGGVGTALGGALVRWWGLAGLYYAFGAALLVTWLLSLALIRHRVVEPDEQAIEVVE